MPTTNSGDEKPYLAISTEDMKLVSDYTRLSFNEILELDCITYRILVKDALTFKLRESKDGQEYLENCWLLRQTSPDRKKLRQKLS